MLNHGSKKVVILDKHLHKIQTFDQGSGDSKLNNPSCIAVGHNVIAVSEYFVMW